MDYFTKWPEAVAIENKRSETVASELLKICLRMGFPSVYSGDQGREFVNEVMKNLIDKFSGSQRISSAYHPQTNGLVEKFNRTLQESLVKMSSPDLCDWDQHIDTALFAYRSTKHKTTLVSPFEATVGRKAFPVNDQLSKDTGNDPDITYDEVVKKLYSAKKDIHKKIKENVEISQAKQKKHFKDKRRVKITSFQEGEKVFVFNTHKSTRKGGKKEKKWLGPYIVNSILNKGCVKLKTLKGSLIKRSYNVALLKRFIERKEKAHRAMKNRHASNNEKNVDGCVKDYNMAFDEDGWNESGNDDRKWCNEDLTNSYQNSEDDNRGSSKDMDGLENECKRTDDKDVRGCDSFQNERKRADDKSINSRYSVQNECKRADKEQGVNSPDRVQNECKRVDDKNVNSCDRVQNECKRVDVKDVNSRDRIQNECKRVGDVGVNSPDRVQNECKRTDDKGVNSRDRVQNECKRVDVKYVNSPDRVQNDCKRTDDKGVNIRDRVQNERKRADGNGVNVCHKVHNEYKRADDKGVNSCDKVQNQSRTYDKNVNGCDNVQNEIKSADDEDVNGYDNVTNEYRRSCADANKFKNVQDDRKRNREHSSTHQDVQTNRIMCLDNLSSNDNKDLNNNSDCGNNVLGDAMDIGDNDIHVIGCTELPYLFTPVDAAWQVEQIAKLQCKLTIRKKHITTTTLKVPINDYSPSKIISVRGDGNCYFRCISYAIVGCQAQHKLVRNAVVKWMDANSQKVEKYFGNRYLNHSNMVQNGTWATEAEILSTASLPETDIVIYCQYGKSLRWVRYSSEILGNGNCTGRCIYLTNENGAHFDYVESLV